MKPGLPSEDLAEWVSVWPENFFLTTMESFAGGVEK